MTSDVNDSQPDVRLDVDEDLIEQTCQLLDQLADQPTVCLDRLSPFQPVVHRASVLLKRIKAARKRDAKSRDAELIASTGIRATRAAKVQGQFIESGSDNDSKTERRLTHARRCYICKQSYVERDAFYDALCPACAKLNLERRNQTANLTGYNAIVTGGRIKIGFQIALKLLRAGANVFITTRFPYDAADRFEREADFDDFRSRLSIFGCDFRARDATEALVSEFCGQHSFADILINNAAQTIRRPQAFYQHVIEKEMQLRIAPSKSADELVAGCSSTFSTEPLTNDVRDPNQLTNVNEFFPAHVYDVDGQQLDRRKRNSWVLDLADVQLAELLEVHAVSSLTPFLLIQKLEPLLRASPHPARYIVNVSAMEGQFGHDKTGHHVHTNMAKAGLNMITRTCADHYSKQRIYMNSVDTGWVTNEFPHDKTESMRQQGFEPPLDEIDGAARVLDPVFQNESNEVTLHGKFLKDYRAYAW